jgi:hypothetical protein
MNFIYCFSNHLHALRKTRIFVPMRLSTSYVRKTMAILMRRRLWGLC